ncbi:hypothetical protein HMPREF6745_0546 [Prevotella sp. oral taxon 472 str. F0295]|nr:hypothetical protein HMPREF6745_0546 [Prevotella sp. oral taxon 472 str. F0295]
MEENVVFPIVIQPYSHVEQTAGKPRHPKTCNITYFNVARTVMCDLLSTPFPAFRCLQNCSKIDAVNIGENHERELHITLYINPLPTLSFLSST